jgi:hypothetical protein
MIDIQSRRPIRVSPGGTAGPYVKVPVDRIGRVRTSLDRRGIAYWVESHAISFDGEPEIAVINLGFSGDSGRVQAILDVAQ